jgi:GT2 family glycosyltransferase
MTSSPRLSVIVPARNAAETLGPVLQAIRNCTLSRNVELIVVDDSSDDATASIAARFADTVVRLGRRPAGPAYARNRGAEHAGAELLAFVDADVVVRPHTLAIMMQALIEEPTLDGISAAYDDALAPRGLTSQYWNLLLSYGQHRNGVARAHLNGACAMLRRSALMSVGMYDEWRFRSACLEDVELSQRLTTNAHALRTDPRLRVTHLRRSSFPRMVRDVWERSVLLSRSLGYQRTRRAAPSEVVFALSRAATPALAIVAVLGLSAARTPEPHWLTQWAVGLSIIAVANFPIHRYFAQRRGVLFATLVAPLHLLAQGVAGVGIFTGWLLRDAIGDKVPDATTQAYLEVGAKMWPPVPRRP